jgi:hypothetical protein
MKKKFNPFTMNFDLVPFEVYNKPYDPDENCDNQHGYIIGDEWINIVTREIFKCVSNVSGEANWQSIVSASSDKNLVVPFTNQSVITITHNFGKFPSVTILDENDEEIMADVDHISMNQCVITFNREFSGKVILN